MYSNIVVGVDGGPGGRDAIALARNLVDAGGQLTLAYVLYGSAPVGYSPSSAFETSERDRARELLAGERDEASPEAKLAVTGSGTVGEGLHRLAEHRHADLLVVGSTRHGLLGRVVVGDDTWSALNGAPCAVAVAPAGYATTRHAVRAIGVAFDGSPESEHALGVARDLVAERDAELSALKVVSLPSYGYGVPGGMLPPIPHLLEDASAELGELEGVEAHAAYGLPAEELAIYSDSVDLLVVGSRGYGPIGRLVHGSVSRRLARMSRSPLLVLTRGARTNDHARASEIHDAETASSSAGSAA